MNRLARICCLAYIITLLPALVQAQGRTPSGDSAAIGGDVGIFLPAANDLSAGLKAQPRNNGSNEGDSDANLGANFGGVEFSTGPTTSVKAEGPCHAVTNARGFNPDGLSLTIGLKKYC